MALKRSFDAQEKRALNTIWNASGNYNVLPPFMAFDINGNADFYFNIIIGLVIKWLDFDDINTFFNSYLHSTKRENIDNLVWLALENYVYKKEVKYRPILKDLRERYAKDHLKDSGSYSLQEMMLNTSYLVLQKCHFEYVLGKELKGYSKREKELCLVLDLDENLNSEEVIDKLKDIIIKYYHFSDFRLTNDIDNKHKASSSLLKQLLRKEHQYQDSLVVRHNYGGDDYYTNQKKSKLGGRFKGIHSDKDEDYIKACLGKSMFSDKELKALEHELCINDHMNTYLWFTKGDKDNNVAKYKEAKIVSEQAQKQEAKNNKYVDERSLLISSNIKNLTSHIDTIISMYAHPLPETSRNGKLMSEKAYRLKAVNDANVFLKDSGQVQNDLIIDLMLDASSSRMRTQEVIAAQAYTISKSLMNCSIPVQVSAFRSLRGYTAIQLLKSYTEKDCTKIFRYFASGWNRDGLAFRAISKLMDEGNEFSKRLLIVLTDANPIDSTVMPPEEGSIFNREYDGIAALKDTIEAVNELEKKGIYVAAIYTGPSTHLQSAHEIYQNRFVRIQKMEQLANGVSELLNLALREMNSK